MQRSAAKSLTFQNFPTTSTSSVDSLEKDGERSVSSEGSAGHSGQGESISSVTQELPKTPSKGLFSAPPPPERIKRQIAVIRNTISCHKNK